MFSRPFHLFIALIISIFGTPSAWSETPLCSDVFLSSRGGESYFEKIEKNKMTGRALSLTAFAVTLAGVTTFAYKRVPWPGFGDKLFLSGLQGLGAAALVGGVTYALLETDNTDLDLLLRLRRLESDLYIGYGQELSNFLFTFRSLLISTAKSHPQMSKNLIAWNQDFFAQSLKIALTEQSEVCGQSDSSLIVSSLLEKSMNQYIALNESHLKKQNQNQLQLNDK